MLCAKLLVFLCIVNISTAESFTASLLKLLPEDLQWRAGLSLLSISGAKAYIFSDKDEEAKAVAEEILDFLPTIIPRVREAPNSHMRFPHNLGYVCWSHGKVIGLNSIQQTGKIKTTETGDGVMVEVPFTFTKLDMTYEKCGYKKGLVFKSLKCKLDVGDHQFRAKFVLRNFESFIQIVTGWLTGRCVVSLVDIELESIDKLGLDIMKRDGRQGSMSDEVLENIINNHPEYIKRMITERARVHLNNALATSGSFVCKEPSLDLVVKEKYQRYFKYATSKTMPYLFEQLCGIEGETTKDAMSKVKENASEESSEDIGTIVAPPVKRPGT